MANDTDGIQPPSPLTSGDVARYFGVSTVTVREWADSGKLASFRTPGGQRRFRREDIDAFIEASATGAVA